MKDCIIRRAVLKDVDLIYEMGSRTHEFIINKEGDNFWTKEQLKRWTLNSSDTGDVLLVAEKEGEIQGYILSQLHKPSGKAEIENIFVKKEARRQGIGFNLILECEKQLKENGAEFVIIIVREKEKPMKKVASKAGYIEGFDFTWFGKEFY